MDMTYYKEMWTAVKREFSRFRALCALLFAMVLIGVVCAGMFWPKAYQSDALVYIDSANVIEPLLDRRNNVSNADRAEQAQKLLYTRSVLRETARKAGLLSEDADAETINTIVTNLRQSITVEAESKNYFRVSYWSSSPERAYQVVDSLLNTFMSNRAGAEQDQSSNAYEFINSQVQLYRTQLDEAEKKLQALKAQNPDTTESAVKARIADLKGQVQDMEIVIEETQSKIATTRDLLSHEDEYLRQQAELNALREQRQALRTELNQLRLAYQESYPDIVSIKEQLAEVEESIQNMRTLREVEGQTGMRGAALFEDLRSQLSVAEVDLKAQRSRLNSLTELLREERGKLDEVAAHEARLDELTRDYNVLLDVYEELLGRQESAKFNVALNSKNGGGGYEVVEPPVYPMEPGGPQFVHFAVAAPVLGLGAPLGLLLALVVVDPRIRSASGVNEAMPPELELLGVVPHFDSPGERRAARAEILMLILFCTVVLIGYGFLVYAGLNGYV